MRKRCRKTLDWQKRRVRIRMPAFTPLKKVKSTGSSLQANPSLSIRPPGMDRTSRDIPLSLRVDPQQRLVFIDELRNEISRIDPKEPYIVESKLNPVAFEKTALGELENLTSVYVLANGGIYAVSEKQFVQLDPDGTIRRSFASWGVTRQEATKGFLFWCLVLVGMILLIWLHRFVYVYLLNRKVPLMLKFILAFVPVVVVSMLWLSDVVYRNVSEKLKHEIGRSFLLLAAGGKDVVSGDELEKLKTPLDYMNREYRSIRSSIDELYRSQGVIREGQYTTLYKLENGKLFVVMDDDSGVPMFRPIKLQPDYRQVIEKGRLSPVRRTTPAGIGFMRSAPSTTLPDKW
ncbi:hypothetical protein LJK87_11205 [Paenibacillus sp. P25]|nr:hypothetical protein LJK87_11205 [Paenibacillus sp. P25]